MKKLLLIAVCILTVISIPIMLSSWSEIGGGCDLCEPLPDPSDFYCGDFGELLNAWYEGSWCFGLTCNSQWSWLCYHPAHPLITKKKSKIYLAYGCCSPPAY